MNKVNFGVNNSDVFSFPILGEEDEFVMDRSVGKLLKEDFVEPFVGYLKREAKSVILEHWNTKQFIHKHGEVYLENSKGVFRFRESEYDVQDAFNVEMRAVLKQPYEGDAESLSDYKGKCLIHVCAFYDEDEFVSVLKEFGLKVCNTCGRPFAYGGTHESGNCYCGTCSAKVLDKKYSSWTILFATSEEHNGRIVGLNRSNLYTNRINFDRRKIILRDKD